MMQIISSFFHLIGWIHWDPPKFAFTLPFIQRPIAWYGIFFALGFLLGFFIIIPIFKRKLLQTKKILERDVSNWPLLMTHLRKGAGGQRSLLTEIFDKLSDSTKQAVLSKQFKQEPAAKLKGEILKVLSLAMADTRLNLSRKQLEYLFPKALFTTREISVYLTDKMMWFVILGTLIGSRLGHVFFYEFPKYREHPLDILKTWEGGLASHGGTIGILLALLLFLKTIKRRFPEFHFADLLDILAIPTAMAAFWIRIGNFFNQEIFGPVTTVPWAVVFKHPFDNSPPLPRHPAQLYEATAYLITFFILYGLWKRSYEKLAKGTLVGLFMVFIFGSRFIIEFLKTSQSQMIDESFLSTGQYLSIPFILMGIGFLAYSKTQIATETCFRRL